MLIDQAGTYRATLTAQTDHGPETVQQTLESHTDLQPVVERSGPTRINPRASYMMKLRVTPVAAFRGEVIEQLPAGFAVTDVSPTAAVEAADSGVSVRWTVDWPARTEQELTYTFDAPDVSPVLFTFGPLQIGSETEQRLWTVAADESIRRERPDLKPKPVTLTTADWTEELTDVVMTPKSAPFALTTNGKLSRMGTCNEPS